MKLIHEEVDGTEITYLLDMGTDWSEGVNEYGIGVVNSALLTTRDEGELGVVSDPRKKKRKDGDRMRHILSQKTLDAAIKAAKTYRKGIKGHTFLSDGKKSVSLEHTIKHKCVLTTLDPGEIHARTNHGFDHGNAGYSEGEDYASSVTRKDTAEETLKGVKRPEDLASSLINARRKRHRDPKNVVRDTDNMFTTSQMVMDLSRKMLFLYLIPGQGTFRGVDNRLPGGRKPKFEIRIIRYKDMDSEGDVEEAEWAAKKAGAPLQSPLFNLRECCKEMVLLEKHLNIPSQYCPDCIRKHFLTVEALLEEALSLDKENQWSKEITQTLALWGELQNAWLDGKPLLPPLPEHGLDWSEEPRSSRLGNLAQYIRLIRKGLSEWTFDLREVSSRVADTFLKQAGWWPLDLTGEVGGPLCGLFGGDLPADLMGDALDKIVAAYQDTWGRLPYFEEVQGVLDFSANPGVLGDIYGIISRTASRWAKRADLSPPLGFPGGVEHLTQRIQRGVRNLELRESLVQRAQGPKGLSHADEARIYTDHVERGPEKPIEKLVLSPHSQYRMDLRSVAVTEVRLALRGFIKQIFRWKAKGSLKFKETMHSLARGEKIRWDDPKIGLTVVFRLEGNFEVRIITVFWKGQPDPNKNWRPARKLRLAKGDIRSLRRILGGSARVSKTPEDRRLRGKHLASAVREFREILKATKQYAEEVAELNPEKAVSTQGLIFLKRVKGLPRMVKFFDQYLGTVALDPRAATRISSVLGALRARHFKPGYKLRDALQIVQTRAAQGFLSIETSKGDAPIREALPESFREFLPPSIVVNLDRDGHITKLTDRFYAESETMGEKIRRQHILLKRYNKIATKVKRDLKSPKPEIQLAALIVAIVMETGIRPGKPGTSAAGAKGSPRIETFGAISLGPAHVKFVRDNFVELDFVGKAGSTNLAFISNKDILAVLRDYTDKALEQGTKYLFINSKGHKFSNDSLKTYWKSRTFKGLKLMDFRKYIATSSVHGSLLEGQQELYDRILEKVEGETERAKQVITDEVTRVLTGAYEKARASLSHDKVETTVQSYINPMVVLRFLSQGHIERDLKSAILDQKTRLSFDPLVFLELARASKRANSAFSTSPGGPKPGTLRDLMGHLEIELGLPHPSLA